MKWAFQFAFIAITLVLAWAIWTLQQPRRFAFRVVDPGAAGSKCYVRISHAGEKAQWICTAPDFKAGSIYIEEIPWPKR